MKKTGSVLFLLFVFFDYSLTKKIPSYITLCRRHDPDFNGCLLKNVEEVKRFLKNGVPELYIPSMNPLIVPKAEIKSGPNFHAEFTNMEIYGADQFELKHLNLDLDHNRLELAVYIPYMKIDAKYSIKGKIIIMELNGAGICTGNYTDTYSRTLILGTRLVKKGKEYMKFNTSEVDLKLGKITLYFDNLFKDNKELTARVNVVINENMEQLVEELKPVVVDTVSKIVMGLIAPLFERVPLEVLFPKK